jgi:hypothetical protein
MELKKTQKQKDKEIVDSDVKEKMRLELIFQKELRNLFVRINKENSQNIFANGSSISADKFKSEFESLLRKHYLRVQNSFFGRVSKTLIEEDQGLSDGELALLISAFLFWRDNHAPKQAGIISNTNQRQINDSLSRARELLTEQEQDINNRALALTSAAIFRRLYESRIENIATTETQSSSESTKLMESATLSGEDPKKILTPILPIVSKTMKMWKTVGDNLVRPIHKAANNQRRELNKAFDVGGEQLMYPGDSSLGATAKNISHCRCSQLFRIIRKRKEE